jgi:branched-chain amino acid aminotransferase
VAIHHNILHNGKIKEASGASLLPGQLGLLSGWGVFSTLRVMNGALFAWPRHWARMSRDAKLMNIPMPPSCDLLELDLLRLVEANTTANGPDSSGAGNCTLRVVVVRNGGGIWEGPGSGLPSDTIALTSDLKQWGESVRLGLRPNARYAAGDFTHAKVISWAHNLRWAEQAQEEGFDEVLLLNEHGRVAECTSANIFAVFGDEAVTPPVSEGCLPGVTREVLLEAIHAPGLKVVERSLEVAELDEANQVFITSSTRDLLAVREVAGRAVQNSGDARQRLSRAFQSYLHDDVSRRRSPIFAAFR